MKTLFKPTSYPKGAALAVGATLVWKVISFANALLLALYFGANRQTDVYFYLIMLVGFGIAFLQRLNQSILIPEAMFLEQENKETARRFINMWLFIYGGLAILISTAGWVGTAPLWKIFSRFSGPILAQDHALLTCGFILLGLQIITYYLTAVAEMYKFFKTAWLGVLNALCPLLCLLLFGTQVGIISMVYGFLVANLIQIVVLGILLKTQLHWHFAPAWIPLRVQTRQNMLTGQTLAVLDMLNSWLPVYLISGMNAGLVSALNYAKQFTDSSTEVFTARVANVAKIEMTEHASANRPDLANQTFVRASFVLLVLLAPLVVFSCYFAPQIIELFLERGQFGPQAAQNTVYFLRPMLFVLLLSVPGYLQNSVLAAERKIKEWFPYALTSGVILTGLSCFLIPRYGGFSYPYILAIGLLIGFILNAFLFRKQLPQINYLQPFYQLARVVLWAAIALIPAVLFSYVLSPIDWVQIMGCGVVFVTVYVGILYVTKDAQKLVEFVRNSF